MTSPPPVGRQGRARAPHAHRARAERLRRPQPHPGHQRCSPARPAPGARLDPAGDHPEADAPMGEVAGAVPGGGGGGAGGVVRPASPTRRAHLHGPWQTAGLQPHQQPERCPGLSVAQRVPSSGGAGGEEGPASRLPAGGTAPACRPVLSDGSIKRQAAWLWCTAAGLRISCC